MNNANNAKPDNGRLPENKCELTIQDLMEGYIMPNDFNTDLLEPEPVSEAAQQRILQRALGRGERGHKQARRGLPRRRLLVFSLAAVMLLVMSSLAVAEFALKQDFQGFFNAGEGQLPHQSGQEINRQVENNGATLTVEQILGDKQSVYVLLDFVAPEGVVLDKDAYQWDMPMVMLSQSGGCGYYFEDLPDDNPNDNHIRMMLCLNADNSLQGQQMDLTLGNLKGYSIEEMDYTSLVDGEWKLSFKLDYSIDSQVINQDLDIPLGDATVHVNYLEISPLTMILDLDVANPEGYVAPEGYVEPIGGGVEFTEDGAELHHDYQESPLEVRLGNLLSNYDYFKVTLQNGQALEIRGGGSSSEETHHQIIFSSNQLLNLEDIASISYLGQELKLQ